MDFAESGRAAQKARPCAVRARGHGRARGRAEGEAPPCAHRCENRRWSASVDAWSVASSVETRLERARDEVSGLSLAATGFSALERAENKPYREERVPDWVCVANFIPLEKGQSATGQSCNPRVCSTLGKVRGCLVSSSRWF